MLHYSETLNTEDKLGHSSSEILFSQAALLPRKLLQLPTESLDTNAHSCRGRTKDFTFITIWELLGGAVGRKLLPSKKPRLLQESRTGVSVCPLSCCHQGPGNPDRNPMCFVKVKGRPKLCTEGYAGTACAGCACLLIFQTVHQIHKLPIKYTREMGGKNMVSVWFSPSSVRGEHFLSIQCALGSSYYICLVYMLLLTQVCLSSGANWFTWVHLWFTVLCTTAHAVFSLLT